MVVGGAVGGRLVQAGCGATGAGIPQNADFPVGWTMSGPPVCGVGM